MNQNDGKASSDWSEEDKKSFDDAIDAAEYGKCVEISPNQRLKRWLHLELLPLPLLC